MRQGAQSAQAPQGSMAEEAAGAAEPEYYPEEQPQEEEPGIEAFREGGVVRMADGGLAAGPRPIEDLSRDEVLTYLESMRFGPGPSGVRSPYSREDLNDRLQSLTASSRIDRAAANRPFLGSEENLPGSLASPPPAIPPAASPSARPSGQPPATTEGQMPPTVVTAPAPTNAPATGSPTRAGAGIGAVSNQQPPAPQQAEGISSLYDRLRELAPSREEYRKDAASNALMQAGLAMMASKDPNALANLGAGGLRGLQTYTEEMKTGRAQQHQAIADEITARRANTEELYRRGIITNQERQLRLQEMRLGQAAGERSEARSEAAANRRLQIEANEAANMRSMLPTIRSRIADINNELRNLAAPLSPTERTARLTELERLLNNEREIGDWLMSRQGLQPNRPAQTEGSGRPPPGAQVEPFRIPGTR